MATVEVESLGRCVTEIHHDLKGDIRELRQDIRELRQVLFVVVAAALVSVVGILFQIFSK